MVFVPVAGLWILVMYAAPHLFVFWIVVFALLVLYLGYKL
jgi:hypothetical protein